MGILGNLGRKNLLSKALALFTAAGSPPASAQPRCYFCHDPLFPDEIDVCDDDVCQHKLAQSTQEYAQWQDDANHYLDEDWNDLEEGEYDYK